VTESSQKLDLLTRFSTVLTLLLTVMSAMRFLKIYLEVGIDIYLVKKARKNGRNPPDDVLRRVRVLDEHAITGSGESMRRLSSSAAMLQNVNIDGDDDGHVNSTTIEMSNFGSGNIAGGDDDDDEDELSEATSSVLVNRLKRQDLKFKIKIASVEAAAKREIDASKREIDALKREKDASKREMAELKETLNRFMTHASYTPSNIPSNGEVKQVDIKDEVPTKMHRNPHWKKLKLSVKTANKFRSSILTASSSSSSPDNKLKGRRNRTKRLSKVMKSRRNSALEQNTKTEQAKSTATAAAADELKVSPPPAPESLLLSVQKKRESLSSNP
jgi:hypothetical protein